MKSKALLSILLILPLNAWAETEVTEEIETLFGKAQIVAIQNSAFQEFELNN